MFIMPLDGEQKAFPHWWKNCTNACGQCFKHYGSLDRNVHGRISRWICFLTKNMSSLMLMLL
ncbi:hypothetical protein BS78_08G102300 [Paspalum vaginatum]|nr:hypothetical protein BS78_08G102300 [Paspalum vaginatum]